MIAPEGCILNPRFPAPCGARGITGYRMIDCMFGALAQALPERVAADSSGGSTLPTIAGYQDGKAFVFCETFMGTWGATSAHDGQEGVPHMGANQSNVSIEMIESDYPIRIRALRHGAGHRRAGALARRPGADARVRDPGRRGDPERPLRQAADTRRTACSAAATARPRSTSSSPGGDERVLPVLMTEVEKLKRGDVYRHVMSGGGGFGDPLEREPERVLQDVIEEKMTPAHARSAYGVVIAPGPEGPRVDEAMTAQLPRGDARRAPVSYGHRQSPTSLQPGQRGVDGGAA